MEPFTHIDEKGNAVMVDVSGKAVTARTATAAGRIVMSRECYEAVTAGNIAKGDVLGTARVAGIMGAKRTSELIPLCHILNLSQCAVDFIFHDEEGAIECRCTVKCQGQTGVEMVYDMCKAVDKKMVITDIHLLEKIGGKSGYFSFDGQDDL